ncbi:hypothetical protein ACLKA7_001927 [Drosophila subpalustris]
MTLSRIQATTNAAPTTAAVTTTNGSRERQHRLETESNNVLLRRTCPEDIRTTKNTQTKHPIKTNCSFYERPML